MRGNQGYLQKIAGLTDCTQFAYALDEFGETVLLLSFALDGLYFALAGCWHCWCGWHW